MALSLRRFLRNDNAMIKRCLCYNLKARKTEKIDTIKTDSGTVFQKELPTGLRVSISALFSLTINMHLPESYTA